MLWCLVCTCICQVVLHQNTVSQDNKGTWQPNKPRKGRRAELEHAWLGQAQQLMISNCSKWRRALKTWIHHFIASWLACVKMLQRTWDAHPTSPQGLNLQPLDTEVRSWSDGTTCRVRNQLASHDRLMLCTRQPACEDKEKTQAPFL